MLTRAQFEERFFGAARWVTIAVLALITLVPFCYMVLLSVKPIDALLLDPGSCGCRPRTSPWTPTAVC